MTVALDNPVVRITTPGGTNVFALTDADGPLYAVSPAHLAVTHVPTGGAAVPLVYGAGYSITGDITVGAASLVSAANLAAGVLTARRVTPKIQQTAFADGDGNPSARFGSALDYSRMIDQEVGEASARALTAPDYVVTNNMQIPAAWFAGGLLLAYDPIGRVPTTQDPMVTLAQTAAAQAIAAAGVAQSFFQISANSMTLFRLIPSVSAAASPNCQLRGYYAVGDGGGGAFIWNASDTTTDNGGTIIKPADIAGANPGRWNRVFDGPIHDLWFGVKADGVTDNTAALQLVENAALALVRNIYYPSQPRERVVTGTITTYSGIDHFGDGINAIGFSEGVTSGYPGSHVYMGPHGNIPVFKYQTTTGTFFSIPAPSWREMNITNMAGGCISLNSDAGGYTNDLLSQAAAEDSTIENVAFYLGGGVGRGVEWYKVFNSRIVNCRFSGGTNNILVKGSDNILIAKNVTENSIDYAIVGTAAGLNFGNMLWIQNNILVSPALNASGFISTNYRSVFIENNFLEPTQALTIGGIVLASGGISAKVTGNDFSMSGVAVPSWLVVNGAWLNLNIAANTSAAPASWPAAIFNAGAGHQAWYNASAQVTITGGGNYASDAGIPFFTNKSQNQDASREVPPATSGDVYWSFDPSRSVLDGAAGAYYQSVMVRAGGYWVLPANAAIGNSQIGWTPPVVGNITDTVNVWVLAFASVASQTLSLVIGGVTYTQALTTTPAWYKIAAAAAVVAAANVRVYNTDTGHGGSCYVGKVMVVKN